MEAEGDMDPSGGRPYRSAYRGPERDGRGQDDNLAQGKNPGAPQTEPLPSELLTGGAMT